MKIFVSDIDDTIYSHKTFSIHHYTKQMISKLIDVKIPIVLASARVLHGLESIINELDIRSAEVYAIASNGSEIYSYTDGVYLWDKTFTYDIIERVFSIHKKFGFNMGVEQQSYLLCTQVDSAFNEDRITLPIDLYVPSNFLKSIVYPTHKLSLTGDAELIDSCFSFVKNELSDFSSVSRAHGNYIDIVPLGIDKSTALTKLIELVKYKDVKVYYAGDSYNDLPLIKIADVSCAVGNAKPEVLAQADLIVSNCEFGGVGEFIRKELLDEKN